MKIFTGIIIAALSISHLAAQTERLNFTAPYQYPEGVAYHEPSQMHYVSSVKTGTIGSVDKHGKYKLLYQDAGLKSSFGMKADPKNNRLWVCVSDPNYSIFSNPATFQKMARLVGIDLSSGKKVADINLAPLYPGKHFANDLTFDGKGNIYVTDSFAPVIYRIDSKGKAVVFAQSALFAGEDVGLNGIVYHPKGFLLVSNSRDGSVYKVEIANPSKITKVTVPVFFPGADGLLFDNESNLVLIQNKGINKALKLSSQDNWSSAKVIAATALTDRFQHPTTGFMKDSKVYLLNSKMNELADSILMPSKEFSFQMVRFQPL